MKKILVILSLYAAAFSTCAQNAYYDAKMLIDSSLAQYSDVLQKVEIPLDEEKLDMLFGLLYKYLTPDERNQVLSDSSRIIETFTTAFSGNPYIAFSGQTRAGLVVGGLSLNQLVGRVAGINVTSFADGLARFLIERANEEINVWFFRRFREQLQASEELRVVFPATTHFVLVTEPYQYAPMINVLREAFRKDLTSLIDNMEAVASMDKYQQLIAENDTLKVLSLGLAAASIVSKLKKGIHPADVIDSLGNKTYLSGTNDNLFSGVRLLSLVSQSVRDTTRGKAYVSADSFKKHVLQRTPAFYLYMGLIWQQCHGISFYSRENQSGTAVRDFLKENKDLIVNSHSFGLEMVDRLNFLEEEFNVIRRPADSDTLRYVELYNFYDALLDVVEVGIHAPVYFPTGTLAIKPEQRMGLQKFVYVARLGNEVFRNVHEQNYSLAVLNFSMAYDTLLRKYLKVFSKEPEYNSLGAFIDGRFIRYAAFMASVFEAESPEDVRAAIRAAALPPGSSAIKRATALNISINSYLGLHYGNEYLEADLSPDTKGWGTIAGLSAPVGVAVSTQLNWPFKNGSLSLFASFIDVGAVASFRFKDDSTEQLPVITLENIVAPGLHLVYGIPHTPLSLGYGWQRGPQLREVHIPDPDGGEPTNELVNGYRWAVFVAVDIPLFNIYSKPR